jgi:ABC-type dipeptide/oligopeptide/nickel transport system permease subunit
MIMVRSSKGRPPDYYIQKRLFRNKAAVTGMAIIIISILITALGYLVMPDSTPDANDGAIQLGKQTPGFSTFILKFRKAYNVVKINIISKAILGQESEFIILPVKEIKVENVTVKVMLYGRNNASKEYNMVTLVLPPYTGEKDNNNIYSLSDDSVRWKNKQGLIQAESLKNINDRFQKYHLEKRTYWLGTDRSGRDILSRLIYGTRISLSIGFIAVIISLVIGFAVGSMAGFLGGNIDRIIVWFMSVVWSIPGIMLVIAITMALQTRGVWVAFVAVGLTMWVDVARVVRGQILGTREKLFVEAVRALGASDLRIVYLHIMPNILGPVIVVASANFASAILLEAGLSFLGLSVQPPSPSWGMMIFEGFIAFGSENSWPMVLFPGLAISIMVLAFNLFGNGIRDAIDPKSE